MLSMAPVFFYILSVVLWLTQMAASNNLTSLEVCHQIRDNRIKILAMGSRGYRDGTDKHRVYLLAEGGYMFVVPFDNMTVDPRRAKGNKLTIGCHYIDASTFFHINAQIFTATGQDRYQKFSFITDEHGQHYLMRLYAQLNSKGHCIELLYLDSGIKAPMTSSCSKVDDFATRVHFLLSLDSTDKIPEHIDQGSRFEAWAYEVGKDDMRLAYVLGAEQNIIMAKAQSPDNKHGLLSPAQPNITTAFGLILNDSATLVLLTDSGKVIVGERKHLYMENVGFVSSVGLPLSEFIECVVSEANTGWLFYLEHYKLWIVLAASAVTGVIVLIFVTWALCRCFKRKKNREASTDLETGTDRKARKNKRHKKRAKKREHKKKKRHNKKSPSTTTGASTSQIDTTSGPSSDIQTSINISSIVSRISGKIKSMLSRSAKSTNKANKSKKSKKSKADKKSSKDA